MPSRPREDEREQCVARPPDHPAAPSAQAQTINEFPITTAASVPHGIICGPDGAVAVDALIIPR